MILLKVDYLTHRFEGGKVFNFPAGNGVDDSIPVSVIYKSPGDFGNITLKYAPTGDTIFDGGIIWMGKGDIHYPLFDPVTAFSSGSGTAPAPDSSSVQGIYPDTYHKCYTNTIITQAWSGIANLTITQQMLAVNARIGLFLYTPSVGIGNPADWDFIWVLYCNPPTL